MQNQSIYETYLISIGTSAIRALEKIAHIDMKSVGYVAMDTNAKVIDKSKIPTKILLGETMLKGNGTGGIAENGRAAAMESLELIRKPLNDARQIIVLCGLGGGTGSGAAPVVTELALEITPDVKCIATFPFGNEGVFRRNTAKKAKLDLVEILGEQCFVINADRIADIFISEMMPEQNKLYNYLSRATVWKALGCLF